MMCSQSVSGSSLLSGYDDDDMRETSGRSRRDFEQIDAVLYDEEVPKRSSIKKICEEWSSKPHFRIRGRLSRIDRPSEIESTSTTALSTLDLQSELLKWSPLQTSELNVFIHDTASGRSSIDSIEGSELTNNSDLDTDDDEVDTINPPVDHRFTGDAVDSFDTDEDDDENADRLSDISRRTRTRHPRFFIQCLKDSVINSLATSLLKQFLADQQSLLQCYTKFVFARNSVKLRTKSRPSSLPPRPLSRNRMSLPVGSSTTSAHPLFQQPSLTASMPFRPTPEPNLKLNSLLRIKQLRTPQTSTASTTASSPRKSQVGPLVVPAPPPSAERITSSFTVDRRTQPQQPISLVGTAVVSLPAQSSSTSTPPTTSSMRPVASAWRYRSATTIIPNTQPAEPITRLPPITIERLMNNEHLVITRSNTISSTNVDPAPSAAKTSSGTNAGSNLTSTAKIRALTNNGRLSRTSRSITVSSFPSRDNHNHSSSTSPARSITTTAIPAPTLRTTAAPRNFQHSQKRPSVSTKTPAAPSSSTPIKISTTHIYQMTN